MSTPATNTILVVDDSAVLRASVRYTLTKAGLQVVEAENGEAGLEALQTLSKAGARPAMIITDVNMPKMDGITFVKEVKKTASRYVPILVLTTESQMDKKAEGKAAGATGWLVKPFEPAQLLELVKKFVR
jgi:two-component system chemotaxis response regulator CheY